MYASDFIMQTIIWKISFCTSAGMFSLQLGACKSILVFYDSML